MKLPLLCLGLAVLAAAVPHQMVTERTILERGQRLGVAHGWVLEKKAAADDMVHLSIALKHRNREQLEALFWAVSDPKNQKYGQHLSLHQLGELIAPTHETLELVRSWLQSAGIQRSAATINREFLAFSATVAQAEELLETQFGVYSHSQLGLKVLRSEAPYSVPAHISEVIDFVAGVHRFPSASPPKVQSSGQNHILATPGTLRKRYNLTSSDIGSAPDNIQAVAQFLGQHYSPLDLDEFFLEFALGFKHSHGVAKVVGPNHIPSGVEASLDIEYIMSLGANIPTWFWSTGGETAGQEPFLQWMQDVANATLAPYLFSVSYGDDEDSLSVEYMQRVNEEFQKAGVRGMSILFASGDSGAGCSQNNTFAPSFPASSPFVTSVGGTMFSGDSEITNYISGGGFSNVFAAPAYQGDAVGHFFNTSKKLPPSTMYNATGRAYPDVSALSNGFMVVCDLVPLPGVAGTSAASPTFAGIVGLLNDRRLLAKKAPLGFLNPLLYSNPQALFDVDSYCTAGCGENHFCAVAGWDACTGLGTPNFPDLAKVVDALP